MAAGREKRLHSKLPKRFDNGLQLGDEYDAELDALTQKRPPSPLHPLPSSPSLLLANTEQGKRRGRRKKKKDEEDEEEVEEEAEAGENNNYDRYHQRQVLRQAVAEAEQLKEELRKSRALGEAIYDEMRRHAQTAWEARLELVQLRFQLTEYQRRLQQPDGKQPPMAMPMPVLDLDSNEQFPDAAEPLEVDAQVVSPSTFSNASSSPVSSDNTDAIDSFRAEAEAHVDQVPPTTILSLFR